MPPIHVYQRPDEASRTPGKSCHWLAEAIVDGRTFTARNRHGATHELARQLVAAGIADAPMQVYSHGLRGYMTIPSLYEAARNTFLESATVPLYRARYRSPEDQLGHLRNRERLGVAPVGRNSGRQGALRSAIEQS